MLTPSLFRKLQELRQLHLLHYWDSLSSAEQEAFCKQVENLDPNILSQAASLIKRANFNPLTHYYRSGNKADRDFGWERIAQGKVGCLLIAGGEGTRLRFNGPKGMFPITLIRHKSLFQLFAEKVKAASGYIKTPIPLAIMTSPQNDAITRDFFKKHHRFGLHSDQLTFFCQRNIPLLNSEGNLFLESPSKIAEGPGGNGDSLYYFVKQGIWQQWKERGIEDINYVLVDNPLADPVDAELVGFHHRNHAEITVKCTERINADEKVGLLVEREGKIEVVEYTEISPEERQKQSSDGTLLYSCANLSLYCFSMSFIKIAASIQLPWHIAFKAAKQLTADGKVELPEEPNAYKLERFIFDLLLHASNVQVILYPREECFAALKNKSGPDSPEQVQTALQKEADRILSALTGLPPPEHPYELAPEFYYPTSEMRAQLLGKQPPGKSYFETW